MFANVPVEHQIHDNHEPCTSFTTINHTISGRNVGQWL